MGTRADLRKDIRSILRLWPARVNLTLDVGESDAVWALSALTYVSIGSLIQRDDEVVLVVSVADETLNYVNVMRGDRGTTPSAHSAGPAYVFAPNELTDHELNRLIGDGINWLYPVATPEVTDDTTITAVNTLMYDIPSSLVDVEEIWLQANDGLSYILLRAWAVVGRKIQLPYELPAGRVLRFKGMGRYFPPVNDTADLTGSLPSGLGMTDNLVSAVKYFVLSHVLKSQEALRSRSTAQSAVLEQRASSVPELLGSSRDLMRQAVEFRAQSARTRTFRVREIRRNP